MSSDAAAHVWVDPEGTGRVVHVYFRLLVTLDGEPGELEPEHGELCCFAADRYRLRVNGCPLGVGPLRGYPEYPEYDRYDLRPYLRPGHNLIAVHVCHDGAPNFHHLADPGGFIAWGRIGDQSLATPGDWRVRRAAGYAADAPCFSFAQPPIELLDLRADEPRWDDPALDHGDWAPAVPLAAQDHWGEFAPRSLPPLDQHEREPLHLLRACATAPGEVITSFRLCRPGHHRGQQAVAYTWLHSAEEQTLTLGTYWGSHFVNGERLEQQAQREDQFRRQDAVVRLRAGWNLMVIRYGLVGETWDLHLALPDEGLVVSAERSLAGGPAWRVAGLFEAEDPSIAEDAIAAWDEPPALAQPWEDRAHEPQPVLPARHLGWTRFGEDLGYRGDQLRELRLPAGGGSLVVDLGGTTLGRLFVEYSAPLGTHLDLGGAEELRGERPWHDKMVLVLSGDRVIAHGGRHRFETLQPRGLRYLQLTAAGNHEAVVIHRLGVIEQTYPHRLRADFACSDPALSELWRRGYTTLRMCSEDVYTDCPWRERTLYGGDLLVSIGIALATSGDTALARRCLELFLQSQGEDDGWLRARVPAARSGGSLSDFPLLVLLGVAWYHRVSGDTGFVQRHWRRLQRLMAEVRSQQREDGLYAWRGKPFIDHVGITRPPISTPAVALIAAAGWAYADLAEAVDQEGVADRARRQAASDARLVVERAWSREHRTFVDGLDEHGTQVTEHHPTAGVWTALFAEPSAEQAAAVVEHCRRVWDEGEPSDPERLGTSYTAFYLLGMCYRHGLVDFAERFMREAYAPMLTGPSDTIWEGFDTRKSLCHVWGCAPTFYLSTRALGVRLGFPEPDDLDRILIAPESEHLTWARGSVPHPRGRVEVEWRIVGDRLLLTYRAPAGVDVRVAPRGRLARLELVLDPPEG